MADSTTNLDLISQSQAQKEVTVNALFDAASPATAFGRRASTSAGLTWGYYGGVMNVLGTPTAIANGTLLLTASATNYIEADPTDGTVSSNTSGFTAGRTRLYAAVTGASSVTSWSDWRVSAAASVGAASAAATSVLNSSNIMIWQAMDNQTSPSQVGGLSAANASSSGISATTSNLFTQTPRIAQITSASAGSSQGYRSFTAAPLLWRGNADGLGGFTISFVFGVATPVADMRMFVGVRILQTAIGNVEPSSLVDLFGMGCDAGEANFSIIHNDAAGTATKEALGADYPVQTTATDLYRLTLSCNPNAATMEYRVERLNTGHDTGTVSVSTELPANSSFLNWQLWINNGSTASSAALHISRITFTRNG